MSSVTRQFKIISDDQNSANLRVAFASDDGVVVNQHFGSTSALVIYWVNPEGFGIEQVVQFEPIGNAETDEKLPGKLKALDGCVAVYCRACGASAVKQLLELNIQPLKAVYDFSIKELITAFQAELRQGPSTWLAKAIARQRMMPHDTLKTFDHPGWPID